MDEANRTGHLENVRFKNLIAHTCWVLPEIILNIKLMLKHNVLREKIIDEVDVDCNPEGLATQPYHGGVSLDISSIDYHLLMHFHDNAANWAA